MHASRGSWELLHGWQLREVGMVEEVDLAVGMNLEHVEQDARVTTARSRQDQAREVIDGVRVVPGHVGAVGQRDADRGLPLDLGDAVERGAGATGRDVPE